MSEWFRRTFSGERGVKTLAIVIAVLLITATASIGQIRHRGSGEEGPAIAQETSSTDSGETFDATQEPGASPTDAGLSPTAGAAGTGRGAVKTSSPGATGSPKAAIPDFGLKTQGITDKEVKIGVSWNISGCGDAGTLEAAFGGASTGDPEQAYDTYVRYINDTGGIGGRTLKYVTADDGGGGCEEKAGAAAVKLADEDKVFLAIPGLDVESDYIISKKIPVIGGRNDPEPIAKAGPNGISFYEPFEPTFEIWASFGKYYIDTPKHPACLLHPNNADWNGREKLLVAKMKKYGMAFRDIIAYEGDVSTALTQSNTAAARAKAKGCEQAWFMAENPIALVFFTQAATQNDWHPTWTWTAMTVMSDTELAGNLMDQNQWKNAIGLSIRVPAGQHPKEGNCVNIWNKYNSDGQGSSVAAQIACPQILTAAELMRRAIKRTGVLNANSLLLGADTVRNNFYWDSHVPLTWSFPGPKGPFKTKGFSHYTVAKWNSSTSKYEFPEYPKYWKVMGADKSGSEDLRPLFKLG
ncbi:MAG: ABC transporter substrate-binding protein [Actinomycetota bacterium]